MSERGIYVQVLFVSVAIGYDDDNGLTFTGGTQAAPLGVSVAASFSVSESIGYEGWSTYSGVGTPTFSQAPMVAFTAMNNSGSDTEYISVGTPLYLPVGPLKRLLGGVDIAEAGVYYEGPIFDDAVRSSILDLKRYLLQGPEIDRYSYWTQIIEEVEREERIPDAVKLEILPQLRDARTIPQLREEVAERLGLIGGGINNDEDFSDAARGLFGQIMLHIGGSSSSTGSDLDPKSARSYHDRHSSNHHNDPDVRHGLVPSSSSSGSLGHVSSPQPTHVSSGHINDPDVRHGLVPAKHASGGLIQTGSGEKKAAAWTGTKVIPTTKAQQNRVDHAGRTEDDPNFTGVRPILLDLDSDGLELTELDRSTVYMDSEGTGLKNRTAWAGAGDGVLFYDADGDGTISDDREYVFTVWDPTAEDDQAALRSRFDLNGDGKLSGAELDDFKVMATCAVGSQIAQTLAALGIKELRLTVDRRIGPLVHTASRHRQMTGTAHQAPATFLARRERPSV